MRITGVRVEVSKTVSDRQYGNERFNAQYIAELEEGEDADDAIRELSARARREIVGQLAESESASIRYAIAPPKDVTPPSNSDDDEIGNCPNTEYCQFNSGPDGDDCEHCGRKEYAVGAGRLPDDIPF